MMRRSSRLASHAPKNLDPIYYHPVKKQRTEIKKWVGAHVSASGGLHNALINAQSINANCLALFTAVRSWRVRDLSDDEIHLFHQKARELGFGANQIVTHGQYIVNLASVDETKRRKAVDFFVHDVANCEKLGIGLYNFHPGSWTGHVSAESGIQAVVQGMQEALDKTERIKLVVENMAGQGSVLGRSFEELKAILDSVPEKYQSRVGVCLDTCHLFAAGYDNRTAKSFEQIMQEFDKVVGQKRLLAMHLNDSKTELGSRKDRHENLGKGHIGLEAFRYIMNSPRFDEIPLILETPIVGDDMTIWRHEIQLLRDMI